MKAIILAGGEGTRLRPLTFAIPKPLIPIGEKPILEIIIKRLQKFAFRHFIFSVGYKAELIRTYFGDGKKFGIKIDYIQEDKPLGTAGSLKLAAEKFFFSKNESFLLMNGDILTRLDFSNMVKQHLKDKAALTVGIKKYSQRLPFGVVTIGRAGIEGIIEKPLISHFISTGIYMVNASCFKEIPKSKFFTMPMLMNKLLADNNKPKPYFIKEDWIAVEHLKHIEEINCNLRRWVK